MDAASLVSQAPDRERTSVVPLVARPMFAAGGPVPSLPTHLTPLVGRERETAAVLALLRRPAVRLVTLSGPGGVGKSRLALRVAAELGADFPDGVWFVDLAPLADPELVGPTIAASLGVREVPGQTPFEAARSFLSERRALLLLDSAERVVAGAGILSSLLVACPNLAILTTSRTVLQLTGEHDFPVPPLVPAEAASLFVERAQAVRPEFALGPETAPTVAAICTRLDGLPLAIELAAARLRIMSPGALLSRLESRLPLLTGGARDLPDRQRTMRDAIDWSHDLLTPEQQTLFRRLAVFAGGFTLDAVLSPEFRVLSGPAALGTRHSALGTQDSSVLDTLGALADHSLLRQEAGPGGDLRFRLLETVREFGLERLAAAGEADAFRARHAAWCLAFAEGTLGYPPPRPIGPEQLDRAAVELANLRAARDWFEQTGDGERLLRLAVAMTAFWSLRSLRREGRDWLERALTLTETTPVPPALRAAGLLGSGMLSRTLGDRVRAERLAEAALRLYRQVDSGENVAYCLNLLAALARGDGDYDRATLLAGEALRRLGDPPEGSSADIARHTLELNLGLLLGWTGRDIERAATLLSAAVAGFRQADDLIGVVYSLYGLGVVTGERGDRAAAAALLCESLESALTIGVKENALMAAAELAILGLAHGPGELPAALRLLGAVERQAALLPYRSEQSERQRQTAALARARARLGDPRVDAALAGGTGLTFEETVAEATSMAARLSGAAPAAPAPPGEDEDRQRLTEREIEVLRLLVEGCSDREIAERLSISPRTAMRHVANIYAKLDVHSRAAAVAAALRLGVV